MNTGARPRAVIVGAGLMGRWHAAAVARTGHAVAAVVDPDPARAAALASRHGAVVAATVTEVRDADVVHVCSPLETHVAVAGDAIGQGRHVIVEKPIAETVGDTRSLLALAAAHGRLLVPVHQFMFQRGVQHALEALPAIGPLLHVDFVACTAGAARLGTSQQDRVVVEILPHPLSLLARLVSPGVAETDWQVLRPRAGELRVQGALGNASVSMLISAGGRPTANALRLIGASGTVHLDLFHGFAVITRGRTTRIGKALQPFVTSGATFGAATMNLARRALVREPAYPGLRELIARFYSAVRSGGVAPISPDECLAVAVAAEQIGGALRAQAVSHL